jgi:hypothetical protein
MVGLPFFDFENYCCGEIWREVVDPRKRGAKTLAVLW